MQTPCATIYMDAQTRMPTCFPFYDSYDAVTFDVHHILQLLLLEENVSSWRAVMEAQNKIMALWEAFCSESFGWQFSKQSKTIPISKLQKKWRLYWRCRFLLQYLIRLTSINSRTSAIFPCALVWVITDAHASSAF